jgi:hypothetical protein
MKLCRALVVLVTATFAACGTSPTEADGVAAIRAETSFGFCIGYCKATLEIRAREMVLTEESTRGDPLPLRRRSAAISAEEWNRLVGAVDRPRIESLPERIGCPDCADGGAESLEVVGSDWRRRVEFEAGASIADLQPLLERVRALRSRFPRFD